MGRAIVLLAATLFLICHEVVTWSTNSVCEQLENAVQALGCDGATSNGSHHSAGKPGKRGPAGAKGDRGPAGLPGQVDYDDIDASINRQLRTVLGGYHSDIGSLQSRITAMERMLRRSQEKARVLEQRQGACEFSYDGKCFYIVIHDHFIQGYDRAVGWCAERGGSPANIYSEDHYQIVMRYMRSRILVGKNWMHLWLGMKFNPKTRRTSLSGGGTARYVKWYPGTPRSNPAEIHMVIVQRTAGEDTGMHNMGPSATREGVLCEI